MSITTTVVQDNAQATVYQDWDDEAGEATYRWDFKAGTPEANREALHAKLVQARDYFGDRFDQWASLTPAQKDTAMKNAVLALHNIAIYMLRDDDAGK